MAIAVNLLALLLVVGLSWLGMMWMAGRAHVRRGSQLISPEDLAAGPTGGPDGTPHDDGGVDVPDFETLADLPGFAPAEPPRADDAPAARPWRGHADEPCGECGGVGAKQRLGRLEPCPVCEGTGVDRATF